MLLELADNNTIAAFFLGAIKRGVGGAQECFGADAFFREGGNAHGEGDVVKGLTAVLGDGIFCGFAKMLATFARVVQRGVRQNDCA